MSDFRTRWFSFHNRLIEPASKEIFSHVEKMVIGTLIISAGAHVSSDEPSIVLFGYLRHSLVGGGVERNRDRSGLSALRMGRESNLHSHQSRRTSCFTVSGARVKHSPDF